LHGNELAHLRVIPCWHRNGLARTDSVLAYGQRGWPAQSDPMLALDKYQARVGENIMLPLQAMLPIACGGKKLQRQNTIY